MLYLVYEIAGDTKTQEDFNIDWLKGTPAYAKLYGYASRYCELSEGGDWEYSDVERTALMERLDSLMRGVAEAIAMYEDVYAELIIELAIDDWYEKHCID